RSKKRSRSRCNRSAAERSCSHVGRLMVSCLRRNQQQRRRRLSGSTGARHGVLPSRAVDNACTAWPGDPAPMERQGMRHGRETRCMGHMRGHGSMGAAQRRRMSYRCPCDDTSCFSWVYRCVQHTGRLGVLSQRSIFGAKSKNRVSEIQRLTNCQNLEKATLRQNRSTCCCTRWTSACAASSCCWEVVRVCRPVSTSCRRVREFAICLLTTRSRIRRHSARTPSVTLIPCVMSLSYLMVSGLQRRDATCNVTTAVAV